MVRSAPRILIAEDSYFQAEELARTFAERGFAIVGPAPTVRMGLALIDAVPIDGAVIDLDLAGQWSYPLAAALQRRGKPFVFITGYPEALIHSPFADRPCFEKPLDLEQLVRTVSHQVLP